MGEKGKRIPGQKQHVQHQHVISAWELTEPEWSASLEELSLEELEVPRERFHVRISAQEVWGVQLQVVEW